MVRIPLFHRYGAITDLPISNVSLKVPPPSTIIISRPGNSISAESPCPTSRNVTRVVPSLPLLNRLQPAIRTTEDVEITANIFAHLFFKKRSEIKNRYNKIIRMIPGEGVCIRDKGKAAKKSISL